MAPAILAIDSRRARRRQRMQHMQHIYAAGILIFTAVAALREDGSHHVVLPAFCIFAGACLLVAALREKARKKGEHAHHGFAWFEIAAALVAFAEAAERAQGRHHALYRIAVFIPPIVIAVMGWMEIRGMRGVVLRDDDRALILQSSLLRRRRIRWEGLRSYSVTNEAIVFDDGGSRRATLPLHDILNREEAVAWVAARAAERGLAAK